MVSMKTLNAFASASSRDSAGLLVATAAEAARSPSAIREISYPTQVDTNMMLATGAEVESTTYASFSRDTRSRSVTGRMVLPTINVFA